MTNVPACTVRQGDKLETAVQGVIATLWESWLQNRHYRGKREREEAFWRGYSLGRRQAARQLALATGMADPAIEAAPDKDAVMPDA